QQLAASSNTQQDLDQYPVGEEPLPQAVIPVAADPLDPVALGSVSYPPVIVDGTKYQQNELARKQNQLQDVQQRIRSEKAQIKQARTGNNTAALAPLLDAYDHDVRMEGQLKSEIAQLQSQLTALQ